MTSAISLHDVSYSPFDGSLFLPEMVEFNARHNATHPFYTFYDENLGDLRHISHLEFYRASQRVAHAVRPNRQGPDSDVVAIVANTDTILYQVLTMGIMLSGLVVRHFTSELLESSNIVFEAFPYVAAQFSSCCSEYDAQDRLPPLDCNAPFAGFNSIIDSSRLGLPPLAIQRCESPKTMVPGKSK